jgi:hypothetical protein
MAELEREKVRKVTIKRRSNVHDIGGLKICDGSNIVSTSTGSNHCASIENKKEKTKDVATRVTVSTRIYLMLDLWSFTLTLNMWFLLFMYS